MASRIQLFRLGLRRTATPAGPPVFSSAPTIVGSAVEDQILTVVPGVVSGATGSPTYQWKRAGVAITDEIATTYVLTSADVGAVITVTQTATNTSGSASSTSNATATVVPLAPGEITPPLISGLALLGQVVTATPASWSRDPTSTAGQWKRDGASIDGQTGLTYTLAAGDVDTSTTYVETATNAGGSTESTSNALGPIAADPPDPGIATITPGVTAVGSWAETDPAALGIGTQGDPADYGYAEQPTANWVNPMNATVRNGTLYIGVVASKGPMLSKYLASDPYGIKEVWFSVANGAWTVVSERTPHPTIFATAGAIDCYVAALNGADCATSGQKEARAIVVPWAGVPFVLQVPTIDAQTALSGKLNPVTATWPNLADSSGGTLTRNNYSPGAWSLLVNIDKTGTALPGAVVYLNTISGNDANTGLSAGQALLTGDAAIAKIKTIHGTSDVGGATIYYTPAGNHVWGMSGTPAIQAAATQNLLVTHAPGLSDTDIVLTSAAGSYGWNCEKVKTVGLLHSGNFTIQFANPAGSASVTYFDTHTEDVYSDGGAGNLDANGQSANLASLAQPNGHNAIINCTFTRRVGAGTAKTTLSIGNTWDAVSSNQDVNDDVKVSIWDTMANLVQAGSNHLDMIQFKGGRRNHIVIDLTAVTGIVCQGGFHDERSGSNIAFIRPRITSTSTGPALGFEAGSGLYEGLREYDIHDPQITGPTTLPTPQSGDQQNVRVTLTAASVPGVWGSEFRYGLSVLWPDTTTEPNVSRPAEHAIIAEFGKTALAFLLDAEDTTSLSFDSGALTNVTEVRDIRSPGGPRIVLGTDPFATVNGSPVVIVTHVGHPFWTGARVGLPDFDLFGDFVQSPSGLRPVVSDIYTVTYIDADHYSLTMPGNAGSTGSGGGVIGCVSEARGTSFLPSRLLPTYSATGLNSRPCLVFDPDNSLSTAGRSIYRTGEPLISAANVVHEFWLIDQQEANSQTQTHHVCSYGGSSSSNSRQIYRTSTGAASKLNWRTTSTAAIQAPGTFNGVSIVHAYYDPSLPNNVGVGLWNAAQPNFVFDTTRYTFGTVAAPATTTPGGRLNVGGGSAVDGGSAGQWLKFKLNCGMAFKQALTTDDIAFVHDILRTRAGF
jgi:hypothetical protein